MSFDQQMDSASMAALTQFLHEFKSSTDLDDLQSVETESNDGQSSPSDSKNSILLTTKERRRIALAAKRQHRYVQKVRKEREMLRQQAIELTAELNKLQKAQAISVMQATTNLSLGAWKASAIRQKERRLQAGQQQRRLKALVLEHSRLIRNMNEAPQQRLAPSPMNSLTSGGSLFKTFLQELDSMHAMTDEVIAGADLKLSSLPLQLELIRDWNQDMTFLESADATVVPFGFDETCHALSLTLLANSSRVHYKDDENTTCTTLECHLNSSGDSATLVIHTVVRRYVEDDRVVFVWRALTEGQGEFKGLYTDETAWYVLRRANEGSAMTLETYTRLMPVGIDLTSETDVRGNEFVKVLAKADEEDVDDIMHMFEKMLLDETHTICL